MPTRSFWLLLAMAGLAAIPALTQGPQQSPPQLDQLVARIALYPDPLLAQVLTASTYWNEIPEAAQWANQHSYLRGDELASHPGGQSSMGRETCRVAAVSFRA
jgi:hypothetical protein